MPDLDETLIVYVDATEAVGVGLAGGEEVVVGEKLAEGLGVVVMEEGEAEGVGLGAREGLIDGLADEGVGETVVEGAQLIAADKIIMTIKDSNSLMKLSFCNFI